MNVRLVETDDITPIANLGQLYQYDFSEFLERPADVGPDGRYSFIPIERHYANADYERMLIEADGRIAGFAIVSFGGSYRDEAEEVWYVDEFFVMRPFRRAGVGEHAARLLFDSRPGAWEVGQVLRNVPAQAFWRKVIGRYTDGSFEEIVFDDDRWKGPVQYFTAG